MQGHPDAARPSERFRKFRLTELLRGERIYAFREFYDAKNLLLRYDDRTDYLNYGFWAEGDATPNPSAALVEHLGRALDLGPRDVLVDVGSGLGQPAIDVVERFGVARVVGVNRQPDQVALANERARAAGLSHAVMHHVGDATTLDAAAASTAEAPTAVMSVEVLAEIPDVTRVFERARSMLSPGGRIGFCDVVAVADSGNTLARRALRSSLAWTTATLYGDTWRTEAWYKDALERAGFTGVRVERIGDRVYGPTFAHARARMHALRGRGLPRTATAFAYANLRLLQALYVAGQVEYAIFTAQVPS